MIVSPRRGDHSQSAHRRWLDQASRSAPLQLQQQSSAGALNDELGKCQVPGLIYHPTEPNVLYARTDVAGTYRWDQPTAKWISITDMFGFGERKFQGVASIALDPTDANMVWSQVTGLSSYQMIRADISSVGNSPIRKMALGVPAAGSPYSAAVYFMGRLLVGSDHVYGVDNSPRACWFACAPAPK